MKFLSEIFDEWITRVAGIVFLLTVGVTAFNTMSDLPMEHPVVGLVSFSLVPILFVAGGIIFVLAILRS